MSVEAELAAWAASLRWEDVPGPTQALVEDLLLDAVASAAAGRQQELVERVRPVARAFAGDGPAADVFVDAYAVTSATICDVYRPGLCHVTPVVVPVVAALAAETPVPRETFLAALTVGLEVTTRLCRSLPYASLRARGWHSPGVVGPVGAAAAGARLLGLDAAGSASALAHGAAQAAGTFAALGTEAVKFNQARGSVSGLLAALMARAGLAAAPTWLGDEDGGLARTYADEGPSDDLVAGLGADWELERISLRRWPAASSVQSLIEACLELDLGPGDVREVCVELSPAAHRVSGPRGWGDPLSAQQSARWVVAVTLADRDWWFEQWSPGRIGDEAAGAFASDRVRVAVRDDLDDSAVRLVVALAGGDVVERTVLSALGDPERRLPREAIEAKLRRALASVGTPELAEDALATLAGRTLSGLPGFGRALAVIA